MSLSYSKTLFSKQQTSQDLLLILSFLLCHVFISSCSSFTWPAQRLKDSTPPPIGGGLRYNWQQWSREEQQGLPAGRHLDGDILPVQFLELGSLMCLFFWLVLETSPCNMLRKLERCSRPFVALAVNCCDIYWLSPGASMCCTQVYIVKLLYCTIQFCSQYRFKTHVHVNALVYLQFVFDRHVVSILFLTTSVL